MKTRARLARLATAFLAAFAATSLVPGSSWATCGATPVCADVATSLVGELDLDGVTISWDTDAEDGTIAYYALLRYDCSTPSTCSVSVATVSAIGSCSSTQSYSYTDDPPAGGWTYVVEVWKSDSTRACGVDVVPE